MRTQQEQPIQSAKQSNATDAPAGRNTVRTVTDLDPDAPDVLKEQYLEKLLKRYMENRDYRIKKELNGNLFHNYYSDIIKINKVLSEINDASYDFDDWIFSLQCLSEHCGDKNIFKKQETIDGIIRLFLCITVNRDAIDRLSEEYERIEELLDEAAEKEWKITNNLPL